MVVIHIEHDIGIHLNKAAIGIISEALILRALRQGLGRHIVETEIEHSIHHARH